MKSLNKKYVRGRGLVKTAVFICFMFTMIFISTMLARGEPARAGTPSEFKAFCWGSRDNFFKLLKQGSESNAASLFTNENLFLVKNCLQEVLIVYSKKVTAIVIKNMSDFGTTHIKIGTTNINMIQKSLSSFGDVMTLLLL